MDTAQFESSANFTETEKNVMRFTTALTGTPAEVSDELFATLQRGFSRAPTGGIDGGDCVGKLSRAIQQGVSCGGGRIFAREVLSAAGTSSGQRARMTNVTEQSGSNNVDTLSILGYSVDTK